MSETNTQLDQVMFPWCASDPNLSLDVLLMTPDSDGAVVGAVLSGNSGTGIERNDRVAKINDIPTQGKRGREFFTEILEVQMENSARRGIPVALALTRRNAVGAQDSLEYKSKVSIKCKGAIFLTSTISTSLRYETHVVIPLERLSKFTDAELAALIGWNKALYSVRSEHAPTKPELELLTQQARSLVASTSLLVIPNTMNKVEDPVATFKYTDQDIQKADIVAMLSLKAAGFELSTYLTMIKKVAELDSGSISNKFVASPSLPRLTPERIALLESFVSEISKGNIKTALAKASIKRAVMALAILDRTLLGANTTIPMTDALSGYLSADDIALLLEKYRKPDLSRVIVYSRAKQALMVAMGAAAQARLTETCNESGEDCSLLAIDDYAFKRKVDGTEKPATGEVKFSMLEAK